MRVLGRRRLSWILTAVALLGAGTSLCAGSEGSELFFGGGVAIAQPLGKFGDSVDTGLGVAGQAFLAPRGRPYGLRFQASGIVYGKKTLRSHAPRPPWLASEATTDNWIFNLALGPQLMLRQGPLRPYAYALAGFSYFSTTTSLSVDDQRVTLAESTQHDDFSFSASFGGGLLIPLGDGLALDLGARYVHNGQASYLVEGDLAEDGEGGLVLQPRHGDANLVEVFVGISFGY